jgi:membrane associated rhomboid family serine protease
MNSLSRTAPVVLNLIILNSLVFFAQITLGGPEMVYAIDRFALHYVDSDLFKPYQFVTHMFMHGSFMHLLFNMLALFMFGSTLERVWGPKRFLTVYFICGLAAALAQMGSYAYDFQGFEAKYGSEQYQTALQFSATVGASGAIMGIVASFGYLFPNTELFIMPIPFPIKAKYAIPGIIAIDVFSGIANLRGDPVAHFAHVGGALAGFLLVLFWNRRNRDSFY